MSWDFRKLRRSILICMTALWMAVIFWFSSAGADASTEMSLSAGMTVAKLAVPGFESWSPERQETFAEQIDYPVRKTAHACEYALLGILAAGVCRASGRPGRRGFFDGWSIAAVYAATDEFHQLFVPGRSGQLSDVALDAAGAAAGVLGMAFVHILWKKLGKREENPDI